MTAKKSPTLPRSVVLEGDLDVFSIHDQWEKLQPLVQTEGGSLTLDCTAMGDMDLSGMQLLCTLHRDLTAKGVALVMVGAKEEWAKRFALLGLADCFGEKAL